MKKAVLAAGIALTQFIAVGAFAQGEVGRVKPPAPAASVAPADKAAARADRKAEGAAAAKQATPGEVGMVKPAPPAAHVAPADKAAARADRKAEGAAAAKAPAPGGEVGPTK